LHRISQKCKICKNPKQTMEIKRDKYLNRLVAHQGNQRVKIITGIRRSGKSYLLFRLFKQHLLDSGVKPSHIIEIQLDDRINMELRNPDACLAFIRKSVKDSKPYYLLIDEVQLMPEFEDVLNSCLHITNLDTYVTGSNSRFLSTDIITEFRGRGDEIYLRPLSFSEFATTCPSLDFDSAWLQYITFGGLPYCALLPTAEEKADYLARLFEEVYVRDIMERHHIQYPNQLEQLMNIISSGIGSLTNPKKLENAFVSLGGEKLSDRTIKQYLDHLTDAFILERVDRYDIKGKKYISTPSKFYFTDTGLRNARINFRQQEKTHLMENVLYNELCGRGFSVDVGVVEVNEKQSDGKYVRKQLEIDFVCNKADERIYIQSAFSLPSTEKRQNEERSLISVDDSFRKVIITADKVMKHRDEQGVLIMGLEEFLLNPEAAF